ncbi:septum formation initiator family protein [uncultured Sphaerochaeta sp.]|uniref:FtsB family cell division protein n=1 Tax=uncultured Sphaerochaeta sp. TaxID=886478 RepID=UPI002A0A72CF|nr:septum formation initiator family protein [uncultured Sphaerochaeta sp.]
MTRKIALLFILSTGISFFLLLGIFGKQGFLCNLSVKQELKDLRYEKEVLSLQVDSLEKQKVELKSGEGLKDAAFKLGYQTQGEQVFYFSDKNDDISTAKTDKLSEKKEKWDFKGLSAIWILIIALAFSLVLTVSFAFVVNRRKETNDEQ